MSTQLTTKQFFESDGIKAHVQNLLGEKSKTFITSVLNIVANSNMLQNCEPSSIYQSALVATTLDLPLNQNLGHAYVIPYGKKAQFQIGWKGLVQLAQRTGQYKAINVVEVYENQFNKYNSLTEDLDSDFSIDGEGLIVGYVAYFKLINGFEKTCYWAKSKVEKHGKKFSKTYASGNGVWKTDFDAMAKKTVLKHTLSTWGILSIEMQRATIADQSVIKDAETLDIEYMDNTPITSAENSAEVENNRIMDFISDASSVEQLQEVEQLITTEEQRNAFVDKTILLQNGIQ